MTKDGMILDRKDPWLILMTGHGKVQAVLRNITIATTVCVRRIQLNNNYGLHEVFQNEVLTSADGTLHGENQFYEIEFRSSMFNEKGFATQSDINSTNIGKSLFRLRA